jgi:hypothetical protein
VSNFTLTKSYEIDDFISCKSLFHALCNGLDSTVYKKSFRINNLIHLYLDMNDGELQTSYKVLKSRLKSTTYDRLTIEWE